MHRSLALSIPILLLIAFLATVGIADFEPGLPGDARAELNRYLEYQYGRSGIRPAAREIVLASRPGRFTAAMSGASYGDSPYYRTTNHYRGPTAEEQPGATSIHFFSESGRPLPYPPVRLWCVLLDLGDLAARRLVLVALHQDLYNADWIVHEAAADGRNAELNAALDTLGCAANSR